MENLQEMDKFLEKYNLPRLNQNEIEKMNGPITRTEIETVVKKFTTSALCKTVKKNKNIRYRLEVNSCKIQIREDEEKNQVLEFPSWRSG